MQLTIQTTCTQRAPKDAANDASYPSFACDLQTHSTNSTTKPLNHQRLKEKLNFPISQFIVCLPHVSEPIRFH